MVSSDRASQRLSRPGTCLRDPYVSAPSGLGHTHHRTHGAGPSAISTEPAELAPLPDAVFFNMNLIADTWICFAQKLVALKRRNFVA